mgnify:CR=1 FL=1
MLSNLKNEVNKAYTENGAATLATTGSDCLDFFATVGALRHASEERIISCFYRAYIENADVAMKTLFFARDVRQGLGERRIFRIAMNWLANSNAESVIKNIQNINEYGRFDDLLTLVDSACEKNVMEYIKQKISSDMQALEGSGEISLLGKWLPSINASNKQTVRQAKRVARYLEMDDAQYRKMLSRLRKGIQIIENNLREKDYTFDYEKQPSKAMFKYRKAFMRNDGDRYGEFLNKVSKGEAKLNTATLLPYEIIAPFFVKNIDEQERQAINITWEAQKDFTNGENALAVIDGSQSMYYNGNPMPATVALSLGVYFAERNKGAFHNHFITFSHRPQLIQIKGRDIFHKIEYCKSFDEVANTNIEKVFELVLKTAVQNKVSQKEMPSTLYIISDMEFDHCADDASISNFENAKNRFARFGYPLPKVVFWNVDSRNRQQPVTLNEQGVVLVSGCTPRIFEMVTKGEFSPYQYMMDILNSKRYQNITA